MVLSSRNQTYRSTRKNVEAGNIFAQQFSPLLCLKTIKMKAEARLDLLRQVGVAVDTWLKSAMNQVSFVYERK